MLAAISTARLLHKRSTLVPVCQKDFATAPSIPASPLQLPGFSKAALFKPADHPKQAALPKAVRTAMRPNSGGQAGCVILDESAVQ